MVFVQWYIKIHTRQLVSSRCNCRRTVNVTDLEILLEIVSNFSVMYFFFAYIYVTFHICLTLTVLNKLRCHVQF